MTPETTENVNKSSADENAPCWGNPNIRATKYQIQK